MDKKNRQEWMLKKAAEQFKNGDIVNLGIGLPTKVANYLPDNVSVILQSENGFLGLGPAPAEGEEDPDVMNAGGQPSTILPGGSCFDSATSFAIIRGGHVDITVLGALQVDQEGNLANWMIPGKMVPGMGGAMDLVVGAKKVIVVTEHVTKDGKSKILKKCSLPFTAKKEVDIIITDMAMFEVMTEGLMIKEVAPGFTSRDVLAKTEAKIIDC